MLYKNKHYIVIVTNDDEGDKSNKGIYHVISIATSVIEYKTYMMPEAFQVADDLSEMLNEYELGKRILH
jgi:hypothetical protein